jgi:hypothetical protein
MIARHPLLTIPDSPRYWTVDVPGAGPTSGPHHFRTPYFGVATAVLAALNTSPASPPMIELGPEPTPAEYAEQRRQALAVLTLAVPFAGLVVGACWWHRGFALESVLPLADLSPASLLAYGHEVAAELQDAEYSMLDLTSTLFAGARRGLSARHSVLAMVQARMDFSEARPEPSTSS